MQVVFIQEGADLDALSSSFALTVLKRDLKIALPNSLSLSAKKAVDEFRDLLQNRIVSKDNLDWKKVKKLYLTDSHSIPSGYEGRLVIYDHHPTESNRDRTEVHVEEVGSATTLVVELLKKRRKRLTSREATLISLGIYEDTGSFKFQSTTLRDIRALEYLMRFGIDFDKVREIVEDKFDTEDIFALNQLIKNIQILELQDKEIGITHYNRRYSKDISRLLKFIKDFESLDGYFAIVGQKNKVNIIARSKNRSLDVSKIVSSFDGGGHWYAASAKVRGFSLNEVVDILKFTLSERKLKVEEFVERDVPILNAEDNIVQAQKLPHFPMYVVVDKEGRFQGCIKDKTVRELIKHGLGEEKVINYIQDTITIGINSYLFELVKLFKTIDQEIFPVLDRSKFIGIVSRRELSKRLFKQDVTIPVSSSVKKKNVVALINKTFPPEIVQELKKIGEIAKSMGYRAFVVGGVVRDMLMGRKNLDIDILVEGDGPVLLKEYGKIRNYSYFIYPEFLTGYVKLPDGLKIDFATARKEVYDYPGAYPRIEKAIVREDLLRRDFSINTITVEITEGNFGTLYDYFGGTVDIKEKRIRVLHPVSFVEDPIRILRAVRFAGRFNFKLHKDTERLLKNAIKNNLLNFAPPGRIKLEMELTFNEENVPEIINLMQEYGILNSVLEIETIPNQTLYKLQKASDMIVMFKKFFSTEVSKTFVYLLTLLSSKPLERSYLILKNYHFDRESKHIQKVFRYTIELQERYSIQTVLELLREHVDVIVTVSVLSEDKVTSNILEVYHKSKNPLIRGDDLIKLGLKPSNLFKNILEDVNSRYIQGAFKSKEDGIKYIKEEYISRLRDEDSDSGRQ